MHKTQEGKTPMATEASFISPVGDILPVATSHIAAVIEAPESLGCLSAKSSPRIKPAARS